MLLLWMSSSCKNKLITSLYPVVIDHLCFMFHVSFLVDVTQIEGGALKVSGGANVSLVSSTFINNQASIYGGAVSRGFSVMSCCVMDLQHSYHHSTHSHSHYN
jgi:hypothetical protein